MQLRGIDFNWVLLIIALVLGGVAAWATKNYFIVKEQELRTELFNTNKKSVDIVVPVRNLSKGETIGESNMSVRSVPEDIVPTDAVYPAQFGEVAGQMLLTDIEAGRPLVSAYLPGSRTKQFSDLLLEGQRAVTIDIDEVNSTAGMLIPSDMVDLYLAYKVGEDESEKTKMELLIERAQVLATGKRSIAVHPELVDTLYDNPDSYSTVTLALSVEDSMRVSLARSKGKFITLLRNKKEEASVALTTMFSDQIFGSAIETGRHQVEFITGGSGITTSIQEYALPKAKMEQLTQVENKTAL
ncbi:Flp pilus assembly protein CpaB [Shewanella cyperi]|uniref:Flp pilus assembly protein CpaB n=1 Tax=Shewanella cyperi TaxID=2814292 RepID=UPI001A94EA53|nr:Flp pilus assembly protein CpaB [Shewanella cyperi]QSX40163.1 Flp pilus assembly protein CpaB [Shewanella cyperi]